MANNQKDSKGTSFFIFTVEIPEQISKTDKDKVDKFLKEELPATLWQKHEDCKKLREWILQLSSYQKRCFYASVLAKLISEEIIEKKTIVSQLQFLTVKCADDGAKTAKAIGLKLIHKDIAPEKAILKINLCIEELKLPPDPAVQELKKWFEDNPEHLATVALKLAMSDGQHCLNELKILAKMSQDNRLIYIKE